MAILARAGGPVALAVSPHPDDELTGAGAALLTLVARGVRVVNLAAGLGREGDRARRRAELQTACARAGLELRIASPPAAMSLGDDLAAAEHAVVREVGVLLDELAPAIVVAPSPHDGHHGHELVGRAVRDAVAARAGPQVVWWWSLWADGSFPSLIVPVSSDVLGAQLHALAAHAGELARNDLRRLVRARGEANAVLGVERVFGYGARGADHLAADVGAELLCEMTFADGEWWAAPGRVLDAGAPLLPPARSPAVALGWWLREPSVHARARGEPAHPA